MRTACRWYAEVLRSFRVRRGLLRVVGRAQYRPSKKCLEIVWFRARNRCRGSNMVPFVLAAAIGTSARARGGPVDL
jgi:hypothetical protein